VNGAPEKPISGTFPSNAFRRTRIASITKGTFSSGSGTERSRRPSAPGSPSPAAPLPVVKLERDPHRFDGDEDIGEKDRRIHAQPLDGLDRDLRGQLRGFAHREERVVPPDLLVFG